MLDKTDEKQPAGRFKKGVSGNPSGQPVGSRNKTTMLMDSILADNAEQLLQKAIDAAMGGDTAILKMLISKLIPDAKERPLELTLPAISHEKDLPAASLAIMAAVVNGGILPGDIAPMVKLMGAFSESRRLARQQSYREKSPYTDL